MKTLHPWNERLFQVDKNVPMLEETRNALFHTFVMECIFLYKKTRPDVNPGIGLFVWKSKRVNRQDWGKLFHGLNYLVKHKKTC